MLSDLQQLLVLQDRDAQIRRLRRELERIPLEEQQRRARLQGGEGEVASIRSRTQENEMAIKKLELDIGTRRQTIGRLKNQQFETRKNEEFRALGHEIERYEQEISVLEDRELLLMETGEQLQGEMARAQAALAAVRQQVEEELQALATRRAADEERLAEVSQDRASLATSIDEGILRLYDRILKSKGDTAIVELDAATSSCGGCHMKVTPATMHKARAGREITHCEQCGRILYLSES